MFYVMLSYLEPYLYKPSFDLYLKLVLKSL